ncbi:MAG: 30S ribosomal protein S8 [Desulfomicrobium escambiense]|nr:30S ribosomal protein S8 [Desulfomicrobium escambiense]
MTLKYFNSRHVISGIERVSRPGQTRVQGLRGDTHACAAALGISIVSTSPGLDDRPQGEGKQRGRRSSLIKVW